ncbi:hypothetical protein FRC05_008626 [Tulasnella sp. 425]|nr:hypothetical protein FRC05_008626 [Tulasnella sp. 425]
MALLTQSPPSPDSPDHEKPRFPCPTCGAQYSRLEYLRRHERKHTEHRPFSCSDCAKTFARRLIILHRPAGSDVLLRHRRRCHPEAVEKDAAAAAAAAVASSSKDSPTAGKSGGKGRPRKGSGKGRHDRRASINTASSPEDQSGDDSPSRESLPTPQEPPLSTPADFGLPLPAGSTLGSLGTASLGGTIGSPPAGMPTMSPTLMPLFMPLGTTPANADNNQSQNQNSSLLDGTSNIFANLHPASAMSTNVSIGGGGFSPGFFNMGALDPISSDPSLSTVWGYQSVASPPPLTDAELFAYLSGEASGNELGLNIFQPERSLIQAEATTWEPVLKKRFQALDPSDRFYLPPGVFAGCYTVPHWMLPPLYKLCRIASHTLGILTSQMSIIHEPTFRLDRTHAFIAFSMCTTGTKDPYENRSFAPGGDPDYCPADPWKWVSAIIRQEKSEMLVKNYARRGRMMSFAESFSLIQALLIFHVPSFLSTEHSNRITGLLFLSSIVQIARQVGLFKPEAEWLKPVVLEGDLEVRWKEWIQRETVRRTTWLVYVLDTIASVEAGITPQMTPRDVRHFPLPAPAPVWNARTADEWAASMRKYPVDFPMDRLMQKTFDLRTPSPPTPDRTFQFNPDGSPNVDYIAPSVVQTMTDAWHNSMHGGVIRDCLGTRLVIGPFARLITVLTLLRGLIEFGEGKRKGGPVTQVWAVRPDALEKDPNQTLEVNILASYKRAFDRWRLGWDIDRLCHIQPGFNPNENPNIPSPSILEPSPCRDSTFMHDATPYFWLGTVLMDLLRTKLAGLNGPRVGVFGDLGEDEMSADFSSDDVVNMFKGLDYRGMLDVAKQFAHAGEGVQV